VRLAGDWSVAVDYYEIEVTRSIGIEVDELFNNRGMISTKGIDMQLNFSRDLPDALAVPSIGSQLYDAFGRSYSLSLLVSFDN
jgi:hypothetical protein